LSDAPTLEAKAARIDLLGQPLLARLELTSGAERLALLGDWSALFRLLSGEAQLAGGSLRIAGADVPLGVVQGAVGLMRLESLLPGTWTSEQFLASSAELAGTPAKTAPKLAFETLEQLGLVELGPRRLAHLPAAERRAVLIAHAVLTNPRVLCLEDPLAGLDTHAENCVLAVIAHASADRRLLVAVSAPGLSPGARQLVQSCTERLRLAAGVVLPELGDTPAAPRVTATVSRNHQAFAAALSARGLTHHATHEAGMLNALTSNAAGPCWRYLIELPAGSSAEVLDAALETEAGLVELIPVPAS
jgi:ABC-2 type transport system ATP-binding protein